MKVVDEIVQNGKMFGKRAGCFVGDIIGCRGGCGGQGSQAKSKYKLIVVVLPDTGRRYLRTELFYRVF